MATTLTNILETAVNWLHNRPLINILLIALFSVGLLTLHDPLVNVSVFVMHHFGIEQYNLLITIIVLVVSIIVGGLLIYQLVKNHGYKTLKIVWFVLLGITLFLHYRFLLEMNIEIIHSFAFSILVFLLYAYFKRFGAAIIYSIPIMLIDEWYQYVILYPHYVEYWELNDILLDLLGGIFMLMILFVSNVSYIKRIPSIHKRSEFYVMLGMIVFFIAGTLTCFFVTHEIYRCEHTIFVMSKLENPDLFWHIHPLSEKAYYILSPSESLILFSMICLIFLGLDSYLTKTDKSPK